MSGLLLGMLGALAAASNAATPDPAKRASHVEVQGVSIALDQNGATVVNVATSGRAVYRAFTLENPDRLVVDLEGAQRSGGVTTYQSPSPLLSGVRVGQFNSSVVRVVADLEDEAAYDVRQDADGVHITLKSLTPVAAAPAEEKSAETQVAKEMRPAAASNPETVPDTASLVAPASLDSALPIATATSTAAPKPEVMGEINENVAAEKAAHVISASMDTVNQAPGQGAAASAPETPQYSGEPISLNLKDVDLKDFFRLIHEISGLNIIVDPNVSGSVTMVLENVPWDQALDIVLKNNQLGKTLEGNVLRIAKLSTLTAEQANAAKLVAAREEALPLVTKFMPVNYAKASTLASLIKTWVGGGALSKRGNVLVDDRTNTLIVSDIASQIPVIESIVKKLDTKTKQVAIEARVERVSHDFTRTIGNALELAFTNKSGTSQYGGASGPKSTGSATASGFGGGGQIGLTTPTMTGFGAFAVSNAGARYIINDVIAAEELKANAKLISKPMIVTQNNVPGDIIQGLEIPVQTNVNNTITITYVQASLQMTVTPQITADGNVFLVIKIQDNTPGTLIPGSPGLPINQQSATTQVLVPDGGTVIFGGVTVNQATDNADYVPVLGKIPVLGNLFKTTQKTQNDLELLFFVTPKILQG